MLHLIPPPVHRALLRIAHTLRHRWRMWRKAPLAGVSVIVNDAEGRVLLLRHSYGPEGWALPGGGIDRGEEPEQAARREVREELGLQVGELELVAEEHGVISGSPHISYVFAASTDAAPQPDRREVLEARFFPAHSMPELQGPISRRHLKNWQESLAAND